LVDVLVKVIEMTFDIMLVDQVTRSVGCATKIATWVRMSSIGPNDLKFEI
jgi:hypothetical protein